MLPFLDISIDFKVPWHPFSAQPCPVAAMGEVVWLPRRRGACREPLSAELLGGLQLHQPDVGRCGQATGRSTGVGWRGGRGLNPIGEDSYRDQLTLVEDLFRDWK